MSIVKIINFLLIAGVIQGFGFNLVTIFVKKKFEKTVIFLNLTVLFLSLNNLQRWLIDNDYSSGSFLIENLQIPWYMLIVPMFYAFTIHFFKVEDRVNNYMKFTLLLFVLELVVRLILISCVYHYAAKNTSYILNYNKIEDSFNLIYTIFLFTNTCLLIFRRHQLLDYIMSYDDLNWIKWFARIGAIVIGLWAVALVYAIFTDDETVYLYLRLSTSILLYYIGYQGFYKYNVIHDRIFLRSTIENNGVLISSSSQSKLSNSNNDFLNEKHQKEFDTIKMYIVNNKLYLDPLLSMEAVSDALRISKSHFSKLINTYSDYNFSDFVNSLRVEQAKRFLSNDEFSAYTIVAIGLECGFNSKSTFYSAFKKFTSETPSSFRDKF
jgi:AraC-like DNA-binding protein